jgi:predicted helicase
VKNGRKAKNALAEVYHFDLYGKREEKYSYLLNNKLSTVPFVRVAPTEPFYFLMPKNEENKNEYEQGFRIDELMPVNVTGVVTARDSLVIDMNKKDLLNRIADFSNINNSDDEIRHKYSLKDSRGWKLPEARRATSSFDHNPLIKSIDYRPFDTRYIYYHPKMVDWGREKFMRHFLKGENIGLVTCRQSATNSWELVNITKNIADDSFVSNRTKERGYVFPLYLYPEADKLFESTKRKPNLNTTIITEIAQRTDLKFTEEKEDTKNTFAPIDVLDYIYAVLHSPTYRERYKEFLKIDFPRVPYPESAKQFWKLVELGGKLRRLHLMEGVEPQEGMADFPIAGSNEVETPLYSPPPEGCPKGGVVHSPPLEGCPKGGVVHSGCPKDSVVQGGGRVYINDTQYFEHVPPEAWNFYIGGYQPAQKWLKDRKGRTFSIDEIWHYQRIIRVLWETEEVMGEVDVRKYN